MSEQQRVLECACALLLFPASVVQEISLWHPLAMLILENRRHSEHTAVLAWILILRELLLYSQLRSLAVVDSVLQQDSAQRSGSCPGRALL